MNPQPDPNQTILMFEKGKLVYKVNDKEKIATGKGSSK